MDGTAVKSAFALLSPKVTKAYAPCPALIIALRGREESY